VHNDTSPPLTLSLVMAGGLFSPSFCVLVVVAMLPCRSLLCCTTHLVASNMLIPVISMHRIGPGYLPAPDDGFKANHYGTYSTNYVANAATLTFMYASGGQPAYVWLFVCGTSSYSKFSINGREIRYYVTNGKFMWVKGTTTTTVAEGVREVTVRAASNPYEIVRAVCVSPSEVALPSAMLSIIFLVTPRRWPDDQLPTSVREVHSLHLLGMVVLRAYLHSPLTPTLSTWRLVGELPVGTLSLVVAFGNQRPLWHRGGVFAGPEWPSFRLYAWDPVEMTESLLPSLVLDDRRRGTALQTQYAFGAHFLLAFCIDCSPSLSPLCIVLACAACISPPF
jgi:hypothetical protein